MNFFSFLNPYTAWIKIGLIVAALIYVGYLNIRIDYLKADNTKLEAKNILWKSTVEILSQSIQKQNDALAYVQKQAENARKSANDALSKARQANTIRQTKINSATARILLKNPSDCATAIADAKKDLAP